MDRINSFFNFLFSPFYNYLHLLLRLTLGISFFLHGFGKLDRISGFSGYLESKGIIFSKLMTYLVTWGEMLAGIGIIISGLIYLLMIPISSMHYFMLKKSTRFVGDDTDHHEDVL